MGALAPSPEDAKKQEDGADGLTNPRHGPKPNLRCPPACPLAAARKPVDDLWIMRLPARAVAGPCSRRCLCARRPRCRALRGESHSTEAVPGAAIGLAGLRNCVPRRRPQTVGNLPETWLYAGQRPHPCREAHFMIGDEPR